MDNCEEQVLECVLHSCISCLTSQVLIVFGDEIIEEVQNEGQKHMHNTCLQFEIILIITFKSWKINIMYFHFFSFVPFFSRQEVQEKKT